LSLVKNDDDGASDIEARHSGVSAKADLKGGNNIQFVLCAGGLNEADPIPTQLVMQ